MSIGNWVIHPITNHQSPITNHQSPITNHQSPLFCKIYLSSTVEIV
ncbi:hypothetical protein IQ227_17235 [Anabaena aphanizomenioides LEGE 00250]|uniref:Uncharacterized protein n=1 Tax=Sphaerospermopsis aphanizomenoides LEGE 00250 TaxID=2777972 RepID=A0ABR9VGW1_9CYAN|nr:hypothetical protein [Sphaerospermopsis aphanizomenoides]MBE9237724.1 hypothetical protein [Sphaerospermopsis aphanizomenoides LEGE 00250]